MIVAGLAALSGSALADGYTPPAPAARPFSWTGFYVGVQGGFGEARADYFVPATSFDHFWPISGGFIGGMIGANYQMGNLVVGIQGEWNASDINGQQINSLGNMQFAKLEEFGSVDGRVGIAVGRALGYVIGGWAFGDPRQRFQIGTAGRTVSFDGGDDNGWDAGFGLEYAFMGGWTGRIEYRHYDFGSTTIQPDGVVLGLPHSQTFERFDTGRIGLAYKFGGDREVYAPLK
jgi:outer membrane immunogenic protein